MATGRGGVGERSQWSLGSKISNLWSRDAGLCAGPRAPGNLSSTHLNASSCWLRSELLVTEKFSLVKWVWFHISCPWLTYFKITPQMLPERDKVSVV